MMCVSREHVLCCDRQWSINKFVTINWGVEAILYLHSPCLILET